MNRLSLIMTIPHPFPIIKYEKYWRKNLSCTFPMENRGVAVMSKLYSITPKILEFSFMIEMVSFSRCGVALLHLNNYSHASPRAFARRLEAWWRDLPQTLSTIIHNSFSSRHQCCIITTLQLLYLRLLRFNLNEIRAIPGGQICFTRCLWCHCSVVTAQRASTSFSMNAKKATAVFMPFLKRGT